MSEEWGFKLTCGDERTEVWTTDKKGAVSLANLYYTAYFGRSNTQAVQTCIEQRESMTFPSNDGREVTLCARPRVTEASRGPEAPRKRARAELMTLYADIYVWMSKETTGLYGYGYVLHDHPHVVSVVASAGGRITAAELEKKHGWPAKESPGLMGLEAFAAVECVNACRPALKNGRMLVLRTSNDTACKIAQSSYRNDTCPLPRAYNTLITDNKEHRIIPRVLSTMDYGLDEIARGETWVDTVTAYIQTLIE